MEIWKLSGIRYSQLKNKLGEVVWMDEVTVNWKLSVSRSSQIITGSRYKPSEVFQLNYRQTIIATIMGQATVNILQDQPPCTKLCVRRKFTDTGYDTKWIMNPSFGIRGFSLINVDIGTRVYYIAPRVNPCWHRILGWT